MDNSILPSLSKLPYRHGEFLDQRRRGNDLISSGKNGFSVDIDDLEVIATFEMIFANPLDVLNRPLQRGITKE